MLLRMAHGAAPAALGGCGHHTEGHQNAMIPPTAVKESRFGKKPLASRGGKRAQKTPNIPKSWGAEQKNPQLPQ